MIKSWQGYLIIAGCAFIGWTLRDLPVPVLIGLATGGTPADKNAMLMRLGNEWQFSYGDYSSGGYASAAEALNLVEGVFVGDEGGEMSEIVKVYIGTSILTRDLVWCECGRGLSLTGKWLYCPTCGKQIDQESYALAVEQAKHNGANIYRYVDEEIIELRAANESTLTKLEIANAAILAFERYWKGESFITVELGTAGWNEFLALKDKALAQIKQTQLRECSPRLS